MFSFPFLPRLKPNQKEAVDSFWNDYKQPLQISIIFLINSITVVIYNKWFLSDLGFPLPITFVKLAFTVALLTLGLLRYLKRKYDLDMPPSLITLTPIDDATRWKQIAPFGLFCGLETAASIWSLQLLHISFHTMIRSLVPAGVLVLSFVMKLQKFRWSLVAVVAVIVGGVLVLSVGEEVQAQDGRSNVSAAGVALCLASVAFNAAEWVASERFLRSPAGARAGAADLVWATAPFALAALLPAWALAELPVLGRFLAAAAARPGALPVAIYFTLVGSCLFTSMMIAEFVFIKLSTALSLSMCHSTKELILTLFGVWGFKDQFGPLDVLGFFVAMAGIVAYNVILYQDSKEGSFPKYHQVPTADPDRPRSSAAAAAAAAGGCRLTPIPELDGSSGASSALSSSGPQAAPSGGAGPPAAAAPVEVDAGAWSGLHRGPRRQSSSSGGGSGGSGAGGHPAAPPPPPAPAAAAAGAPSVRLLDPSVLNLQI